jgi:parallel beta-helix repeat protein
MRIRKDGKIYIVFSTLAVLLPLIAVSCPLYALQCGDIIRQDTVLHSNIGPCPGDGLVIEGHGFALNLNGFSISGRWGGSGVRLTPIAYDFSLKGPGMIANFRAGIVGQMGTGGITIQEVTFVDNTDGIDLSQSRTPIRILENTIRGGGGQRGSVGISLGEMSGSIEENTITGQSTAGIVLTHVVSTLVTENTISKNMMGINVTLDSTGFTISGNRISHNEQDGILLQPYFGCANSAVEDNDTNHNGGSGIVVSPVVRGGCLIQNNTAEHNKVYGISVVPVSSGPDLNKIIGNRALRNGTDLFWNGVGNNCWKDNRFQTSQPKVLPPCN